MERTNTYNSTEIAAISIKAILLHCRNGNYVRALVEMAWLNDLLSKVNQNSAASTDNLLDQLLASSLSIVVMQEDLIALRQFKKGYDQLIKDPTGQIEFFTVILDSLFLLKLCAQSNISEALKEFYKNNKSPNKSDVMIEKRNLERKFNSLKIPEPNKRLINNIKCELINVFKECFANDVICYFYDKSCKLGEGFEETISQKLNFHQLGYINNYNKCFLFFIKDKIKSHILGIEKFKRSSGIDPISKEKIDYYRYINEVLEIMIKIFDVQVNDDNNPYDEKLIDHVISHIMAQFSEHEPKNFVSDTNSKFFASQSKIPEIIISDLFRSIKCESDNKKSQLFQCLLQISDQQFNSKVNKLEPSFIESLTAIRNTFLYPEKYCCNTERSQIRLQIKINLESINNTVLNIIDEFIKI